MSIRRGRWTAMLDWRTRPDPENRLVGGDPYAGQDAAKKNQIFAWFVVS